MNIRKKISLALVMFSCLFSGWFTATPVESNIKQEYIELSIAKGVSRNLGVVEYQRDGKKYLVFVTNNGVAVIEHKP